MSSFKAGKSALDRYFVGYKPVAIKKGSPLFYQGEIPPRILYLKSGIVKLYNITSSGEEKIVGLEAEGSLVPSEWIFDFSPVSLYYYDTYTDCELYSTSKEQFLDYVNSTPELASSLMMRYISLYIGSTMHLHALEQQAATEKILHILQYLVLKFGKKVGSGRRYEIRIQLTHQGMANLVGLTRETVSSIVGKLREEKIIDTNGKFIIIDTDKAVRRLGENDFSKVRLSSGRGLSR